MVAAGGGGGGNLLTPHYVREKQTEGYVARVNKEKRYRVISGLRNLSCSLDCVQCSIRRPGKIFSKDFLQF